MRIALSTPMRWATGLTALVTVALLASQLARSEVSHRVHVPAQAQDDRAEQDAARAARAALSQTERELDALTDRVTAAVDAYQDAVTDAEMRVRRAELERLRAEVAVERRLVTERARQLGAALGR